MNTNIDYLIVGAGPAGLQMGYFLKKNGRDYLILERSSSPGAFFVVFPRHKQLISINKVYTGKEDPEVNLRWDWNSLLSDTPDLLFKNYSKRYFPSSNELVRYLGDYAAHYDLKIRYDTTVRQVSKDANGFVVRDEKGNTYQAKRLIMATGVSKPYLPAIPGIELGELYGEHSISPRKYENKRVLIIGKGNSAFETANHLSEKAAVIHLCSPNSIVFAWQTHFVGNLRAVNNDFLDTYQLKSQNTVIDATVDWIKREGDKYQVHISYSHAMGQTRLLEYDAVIVCTGFRFDADIFDKDCRPQLIHWDKFPAQTSEWESANVPDLYFAGTLMQACDFKKTMSGFIHGFRYNIRALSNIFELKYHGFQWPAIQIPATPEALMDRILYRINNGSGIFLQPGFLSDVVVVSDEDQTASYYEDIRLEYVAKGWLGRNTHYYTITLAYGKFEGDPFQIERDPSPEMADHASYLHPIIRRYHHSEMVSEHHIQDDLESEWRQAIYTEPAMEYFQSQLSEMQVEEAPAS